jgi:Rrf2 family protein
MKISTKGRYALRALTHLAYSYEKNNNTPVSIKDINKKEQISMRYLENIFVRLRKAGLVKSLKGEKGGFFLSMSPSEINLYQILNAAETHFTPSSCVVSTKYCKRSFFCGIRKIWLKLDEKIKEFLQETTLKDVMEIHLVDKRR